MAQKTDKTTKKDISLLSQFELFYEAVPGFDYSSQTTSSTPKGATKTLKRNRK